MTFREAKRAFERAYWVTMLNRSGANISLCARLSGSNRTEIYKILARCGIALPNAGNYSNRGKWDRPIDEEAIAQLAARLAGDKRCAPRQLSRFSRREPVS
jgi:hypothetical protein